MIKSSTIIKGFVKRGWTYDKMRNTLYSYDSNTTSRIFGKVEGNFVSLTDARWKDGCNVHIDSFWHIASMKSLEETLDRIEKIYKELCGTKFKQGD
jgi:hypothetical protein